MVTKKQILVTNDDGFDCVGLKYLVDALKPLANVIVVAPSMNKSACSHSMTLTQPLRFKYIDKNFYRLDDGTPTDCVFLALHNLYPKGVLPDLVISGINIGSNMGEDITYSGTVAGAMEGVLQGVPSIAISQVYNNLNNSDPKEDWDFELACKTIVDITKRIFEDKFPLGERKLLNINIPQINIKECNGVKITRAGHRIFGNDCHKYLDPKGCEFHWIGLHPLRWDITKAQNCDFSAIDKNYVAITPVRVDMTSYDEIQTLDDWIL
ncbi:5-nucleotidase SurE [hydrothermal vent metagenome]|uniref:5'-nucleotidase n=1 Tax=hydrothermal vent metagenome TaxID=652676 RepID=A0A3B1E4C3_9ZZZZ